MIIFFCYYTTLTGKSPSFVVQTLSSVSNKDIYDSKFFSLVTIIIIIIIIIEKFSIPNKFRAIIFLSHYIIIYEIIYCRGGCPKFMHIGPWACESPNR